MLSYFLNQLDSSFLQTQTLTFKKVHSGGYFQLLINIHLGLLEVFAAAAGVCGTESKYTTAQHVHGVNTLCNSVTLMFFKYVLDNVGLWHGEISHNRLHIIDNSLFLVFSWDLLIIR